MISENLTNVLSKLKRTAIEVSRLPESIRLVAVSKTKPNEDILMAYNAGQRYFGENYVQELVKKSKELPKDIKWHYIGSIQSGKVKDLCLIENLSLVETIDSIKIADAFQKRLTLLERKEKLNVLVQVNTSAEDNKSGVEPDNCVELVEHVFNNCPLLSFKGLMTIGKFGEEGKKYFKKLSEVKLKVIEKVKCEEFELSMGMSNDFEDAIREGSTNIRVGSTIFGVREREEKK